LQVEYPYQACCTLKETCYLESYHDLSTLPNFLVIPFSRSVSPMSTSQNPAPGNDAIRDAAPPPVPPRQEQEQEQEQEPPHYSEQATIEPVAGEASSSSHTNAETQPNGSAPARPVPKGEASSYVGSYRPSDAQSSTTSVFSSVATSCAHKTTARPQSRSSTTAPITSSTNPNQQTLICPHPHILNSRDN
jgi:hypothetical protein